MKKVNLFFAAVLIISCTISTVANYSDVLASAATTIAVTIGVVIALIAMLQVYHYRQGSNFNPGWFWFSFSSAVAAIMVVTLYSMWLGLSRQLGEAILFGFVPAIMPVIGVILGDSGRIIIKDEQSSIWWAIKIMR